MSRQNAATTSRSGSPARRTARAWPWIPSESRLHLNYARRRRAVDGQWRQPSVSRRVDCPPLRSSGSRSCIASWFACSTGRNSGLTVSSSCRMLLDGSTTSSTSGPLNRHPDSSRPPSGSFPITLSLPDSDGMSDAQNDAKRLLWVGIVLGVLVADPGRGLVLADLPALLLSRHGRPAPRPARGQGQEVRGAEPSAPQRHLQRADLGGRLLRPGGQRLAGRGPGHPLRRPAPARGPRTARALRAGPDHPRLPARPGGRPVGDHRRRPAARPRGKHRRADPREDPRRDPARSPPTTSSTGSSSMHATMGSTSSGRDGMAIPWSSCVIRRTSSARTCSSRNFRSATGQIRLAGRSDRTKGAFRPPRLPSRKVLQSKFPRRKIHGAEPAEHRAATDTDRPRRPVEPRRARPARGRLDHSMAAVRPLVDPPHASPGRPRPPPRSPDRPPMIGKAARPAGRLPGDDRRIDRPGPQTSPASSMKSQCTPFQSMLEHHEPPACGPPASCCLTSTRSRNHRKLAVTRDRASAGVASPARNVAKE